MVYWVDNSCKLDLFIDQLNGMPVYLAYAVLDDHVVLGYVHTDISTVMISKTASSTQYLNNYSLLAYDLNELLIWKPYSLSTGKSFPRHKAIPLRSTPEGVVLYIGRVSYMGKHHYSLIEEGKEQFEFYDGNCIARVRTQCELLLVKRYHKCCAIS